MEVMIIDATCGNLICSVRDRFERSGKKRAIPFSKTRSTFLAIPHLFERLFFIHVFVVRLTVAQDLTSAQVV